MKIINVSEFRTNLKQYLEVCEREPLIVTSSKGKSFVLQPLENVKIDLNEGDIKSDDLKKVENKLK